MADWRKDSPIDRVRHLFGAEQARRFVATDSRLEAPRVRPPYFPRAPATSRRTPAASPRLTLVQRPAAPRHVRRLRPPLRGRPRRARRFDARVQEGHRCRAPARAPRATRLRGDPHRARRRDHPEGHQGRAREGHAGTCAQLRRPPSPATSPRRARFTLNPVFFRGAKTRCDRFSSA